MKKMKKMTLHRETLRNLGSSEVSRANGGYVAQSLADPVACAIQSAADLCPSGPIVSCCSVTIILQ
jgi:hypothetical protein